MDSWMVCYGQLYVGDFLLILVVLQQRQQVFMAMPVFHVEMALQGKDMLMVPSLEAPSRFQPTHPSSSYLPPMYEIQRI
jgi:hypothetical protein